MAADCAVVLAAGRGSRVLGFHKMLLPVAGVPLIEHVLRAIANVETVDVCVVVVPPLGGAGDLVHDVHAWVGSYAAAVLGKGKTLRIVVQKEPLGTGNALACALNDPALSSLGNDLAGCVVVNGDMPLISSDSLARALRMVCRENPVVMATFIPENPAGYGRVCRASEADSRVIDRIVEDAHWSSSDDDPRQECYSGIMAARLGDLVEALSLEAGPGVRGADLGQKESEIYLTALPQILPGNVWAMLLSDSYEVTGINTLDQLSRVEMLWQERRRRQLMTQGVLLHDPAQVWLHCDTEIAPGTRIEPAVWFGAGVKIGANCHVRAFCYLEGVTIGHGVSVGPFARIRGDCVLGGGSRVGNFVEVKNSHLAEGVKVGHLAYLGDARVGAHSNIGAGAITCNYDGTHKHRTVIGQHCLIGANSALVAPIDIGDNVVVGAGSAVTQPLPAQTVAVERAPLSVRPRRKQQNKPVSSSSLD